MKDEQKLPDYCEKALRYYIGEKKAYPMVPEDTKAYNTINTFFFDGLDSERMRAAEKKTLNPDFLKENMSTLALCADLMAALRFGGITKGEETLYRLTRETDVEAMKRARTTISFTSTSKKPYLKEYATKINLILLEFHIPAHTPRADMMELLTDYAKPEEQEVLLPPWLPVELKEVSLSDEEMTYRDYNDQPPKAKYIVEVTGDICYPLCDNTIKVEPTGCEAGKAVYDALNNGIEPDSEDIDKYLEWKAQFVRMVTILARGMKLKDAISHEIDECQYITEGNYSLEDLFIKEKGEEWIMALLGVSPASPFAERIRQMSQPRLIHTITTYLLGCHIQENLLLSFDTLPRIFSAKTKGSAFSFFWSMACLCHDMGYMYENEKNYKDRKKEMLTPESRKALLGLTIDVLSLDKAFLDDLGLNKDEYEWVEKSIDLVNRYNEFRVGLHNTIDHGIAGALIMFDYMMSIADIRKREVPSPLYRNPQKAAEKEPQIGHAKANRGHSRFRACCLMIALTVARHNIWVTKKGKKDETVYRDNKLSDLIMSGDDNELLKMSEPLDQLLYMLDYMDTIDLIKALYVRVAEGKTEFDSNDLEPWKNYLLNDITIRCVHRSENWQDIDFQFAKLEDGKDALILKYITDSSQLTDWLNTKKPVFLGSSIINYFFPVTKRTSKPNAFDIKDEEILDLCLYEGCGDSVRPGLFYQLPNAYQTFNLLMMDGLIGENIRIGKEKQSPNGVYIRNWRRTISVFKNVFAVMCKYYTNMENVPDIEMYRADRQINTDMMFEHGKTIAFTSTSTAEFLENFARGKKNLTYLKCSLSHKVPIADFEAILGDDYVYSDEAEVLLPPWLSIKNMEDTGKKVHPDEAGEKIGTYSVVFGDMSFDDCSNTREELTKILDENCEGAANTLDKFRNNPDMLENADVKDYPQYTAWKDAFRKLINIEMSEMWKTV